MAQATAIDRGIEGGRQGGAGRSKPIGRAPRPSERRAAGLARPKHRAQGAAYSSGAIWSAAMPVPTWSRRGTAIPGADRKSPDADHPPRRGLDMPRAHARGCVSPIGSQKPATRATRSSSCTGDSTPTMCAMMDENEGTSQSRTLSPGSDEGLPPVRKEGRLSRLSAGPGAGGAGHLPRVPRSFGAGGASHLRGFQRSHPGRGPQRRGDGRLPPPPRLRRARASRPYQRSLDVHRRLSLRNFRPRVGDCLLEALHLPGAILEPVGAPEPVRFCHPRASSTCCRSRSRSRAVSDA